MPVVLDRDHTSTSSIAMPVEFFALDDNVIL